MGPERRGSKKSFCPRRAAAAESRYLLVVSTGRAGNGERVLMIAHSCCENPFSLSLLPDWLESTNAEPNSRPKHNDFRKVFIVEPPSLYYCRKRPDGV